jgi:heme-degrading monooxygenase HmoA
MFAATPDPPYYAVIFTSIRTETEDGYKDTEDFLEEMVKDQPGFLGMESVRQGMGITVCYWKDLDSIRNWAMNPEHQKAQARGKEEWYADYRVRVCKVERELWQSKESG